MARHSWRILRAVSFAAAVTLVASSGGQALAASEACDLVNFGGFNQTQEVSQPVFTPFIQLGPPFPFQAGEKITVTFVVANVSQPLTLEIRAAPNNFGPFTVVATQTATVPATVVLSYTVTGTNDTAIRLTGAGIGPYSVTYTATCQGKLGAERAAAGKPTDSLSARMLQNAITPVVAHASGHAITGAIIGAIGDTFGNGASPFAVTPNGIVLKFTGEPARDPRVEEAFEALSYAATGRKRLRPVFLPEPEWNAWVDVRGTGFRQNEIIADNHGSQLNVTGGIARKLNPYFLIGLVTGYEQFKYDVVALTETLKGTGGTVGAYAAWRIAPQLRWDAAVAWSEIAYNATAGTASGSFTGRRWIASTGLTGLYSHAPVHFGAFHECLRAVGAARRLG
jgi:hypothetical protein